LSASARSTSAWQIVRRLVLLALAAALAVALSSVDWEALRHRTPSWVRWQAAVIFLTSVEAAYTVSVVLTCVGIPALGWRLWVAVRRGENRPVSARGLLVLVSLLVSLIAAEAASAVWAAGLRRATALPAVGRENAKARKSVLDMVGFGNGVTLPIEFVDPPDDLDIDLVVVGESSAEGVPFQKWLSIGKLIAWKIEESIPGRRVRLQVVARSGDTLERQHQALASLERRPELLIVYCGHNEFQSRLFAWRDPEHYFVDGLPTVFDRVLTAVERVSPFCGLIKRSADRCRVAIPPPPDRQRDMVDVPVYTAAEYDGLLADFSRRLEAIVAYAERVGALPVLILPPANDAGFEPNRSFLDGATPRYQRDAFRAEFRAARRLESADLDQSIDRYRALIRLQPGFAEAHYRLGQLLQQKEAWDEAYAQYIAARDCDGYPMRLLSSFQAVYREVAARHDCVLVDGQAYFHSIGRHGLLDDELFQDAMHPSLRGQIALAQAVLGELRTRRAFGWPQGSTVPVIDPVECVAHFGIGPKEWKYIASWWAGFNALVARLRYDDSERRQRIMAAEAAAERIEEGTAPEDVGLPNVGIPRAVPIVSASK
jgi:hypothetical protein